MKTIRIVNCSDALFWYAEYIGRVFNVICEDSYEYIVRTPEGTTNVVRKKDCEVI